ncbi:MAG: hypothetical protein K5739_03605 [Lachnospiraceae bacterium]|nr:hypothetical protein [Lachnospiraceae bacterium]
MSQKKMEAYKEAKKNVRQTRQKEKRNRIIGWILGILCAAALIAGSVFLIYYTNVIKPKNEAEAAAKEAAESVEPTDESKDAAKAAVSEINSLLQDNANSSEDAAPAADEDTTEVDASGAQAAPAEAPAEDAGSESEDQ